MNLSGVENLAITGANGFVGRSIIDLISSLPREFRPKQITLITRRGLDYHLSEEFSKKCTQVRQDLTTKWEISGEISHLVNLAADGSANPYSRTACEQFEHISSNLISWMRGSNCSLRIFHASSGACFGYKGLANNHKIVEDRKVAFARNRISVEEKLIDQSDELGFGLSIGRLFSFSGKHILMKPQYAISDFIQSAVLTGKINVLGDPMTQRSYLHQTSMSEWILKALISTELHRNLQIGSSIPVTISELADFIAENTDGRVFYSSNPNVGDIYIPDNRETRIKLEVGEGVGWKEAVLQMIAEARAMNNA